MSKRGEYNEFTAPQLLELIKLIQEQNEEILDEFYWKNVAPLLEQLKKDGKAPKQSNKYAFYPKKTGGKYGYDTDKNILEYNTFFQTLGVLLSQEGYIKKSDHNLFINSFNGIGNPKGKNKIEWFGAINHCPYLIDCLIEQKIILDSKRNKNVEEIFSIKNAGSIREGYWKNKSQKPKDYKKINSIIETSFMADSFMYETLKGPISNKK